MVLNIKFDDNFSAACISGNLSSDSTLGLIMLDSLFDKTSKV